MSGRPVLRTISEVLARAVAAMLLAITALTIAPTLAQCKDQCQLGRLSACADTNQLVWDEGFQASVRRFLGSLRASYVERNGLVADQILSVLGGPPDVPVRIGALFRFTACRPHSCPEKGAAVLEPDGRLQAVAILHSPCAEASGISDCYVHQTLTIFVRTADLRDVTENLSEWAITEVAHAYHPPSLPPTQFDGAEVKVLKYSRSRGIVAVTARAAAGQH